MSFKHNSWVRSVRAVSIKLVNVQLNAERVHGDIADVKYDVRHARGDIVLVLRDVVDAVLVTVCAQ